VQQHTLIDRGDLKEMACVFRPPAVDISQDKHHLLAFW
jgi:hypothetical protein